MRLIPRHLALFAATLLSPLVYLFGQGTAPAAPPAATFQVPTANDTSLLWRISGDALEKPSYLFGTIHIIPAEDYFLPDGVVQAINDAEEVYFEIDPSDMQNPAVMMGLMNRINMRGDTSLDQLLSPARYDSVAAYFKQSGLPMMMLDRMKPMFLSSMVGQDFSAGNPFAGGAEGEAKMKSYEMELSKIAEAADKPIVGLETMEFQLSLFDSIPYGVQAEMLFQSVQEEGGQMEEGTSQLDRMVALYRAKSVADMAQMITDESEDYGNFEELLVVRRNENWIPIIEEKLPRTPAVYAVGAGHLGGERGVIALLRAAGYEVEPVYP